MKTIRSFQLHLHNPSIHKPSITQSHNIHSLAASHHDRKYPNLFYVSQRYKVANPRMSRGRQQVENMDFRRENIGQFGESGHEDPNYMNLDWTLPENEFLKDIDSELLKNTYVEYNDHWMKNFIKFTDAEFEAFNTKKQNDKQSEFSGFAKIPESDSDEISQSLQYLDEWKKNLKERNLEDDYQVKLPNGLIIPYKEYLSTLNETEKDTNKAASVHNPKQLEAIKRHAEWHQRPPVHDEYGRSHGLGWRKNARATAMVYEGEGEIYVNGVHYSSYFRHCVDRLNVSIPFLVCDLDRKLNAWCEVKGGGSSGQSGAIREAVAKAMAMYNPKLYPYLYAYRLTIRDWRKKERKKSGRPKARKSVRWKAR